jgi:hypothetical protein
MTTRCPKALARSLPEAYGEHGWHADVPGPSEAGYPTVKVDAHSCRLYAINLYNSHHI